MKIAVTGAGGHIGVNLIRFLLKTGQHQIRALVHRSPLPLSGLETESFQGDIMDPESLKPFTEGMDVVFHLAAVISIQGRKFRKKLDHNVQGTRNVLSAARLTGVKRFIHFSSIHALVQAPYNRELDETRSLAESDRMFYSRSKAASEACVWEAVGQGMDAVILSPTAVLGPYDYAPSLLGKAFILMAQGKLSVLVPGGYDWVDVRDVASAAAASITKGKKGARYLLSGHWMDLKTLAQRVGELSGNPRKRWVCPCWPARLALPFIRCYCGLKGRKPLYTQDSLNALKKSHQNISRERAGRDLDYKSRPLDETLRDTLDWFRKKGYLFR